MVCGRDSLVITSVSVADRSALQHAPDPVENRRAVPAVGTRVADALGLGGRRLRCGCEESCWCKRPGLTVLRWVTPGRWHHIGLTPDEKDRSSPGT
jgi:hypothetical protein